MQLGFVQLPRINSGVPERTKAHGVLARKRLRVSETRGLTSRMGCWSHLRDRGGPDGLRWFWSMTVNGPMTRSDRMATLQQAKAQFAESWDAWKAWAKLEETP